MNLNSEMLEKKLMNQPRDILSYTYSLPFSVPLQPIILLEPASLVESGIRRELRSTFFRSKISGKEISKYCK